MIRNVERYQTADGKLFERKDKALEHVADKCREVLDQRLDALQVAGYMTASDRYRIVMAFVPDAQAAKALADALNAQFVEEW